MPSRPLKPCLKAGCRTLTQSASRYCPTHEEYGLRLKAEHQAKLRQANDGLRRDVAYDRGRGTAAQRGYGSRWRTAREVFLRENPLCEEDKKSNRMVPATVIDHKEPHRGDPKKFWDKKNWQALCAACHNKKTMMGQ